MGQKERRNKPFTFAAGKSMAELGFPDRIGEGERESQRSREHASPRKKQRKRKYGMSTLSFEDSSDPKSGRRPRELKIRKPLALRGNIKHLQASKDANLPADIVDPIVTPVFTTPRNPPPGKGLRNRLSPRRKLSQESPATRRKSDSINQFSQRSGSIDRRLATDQRNEHVPPEKQSRSQGSPYVPAVRRRILLSASTSRKRPIAQTPDPNVREPSMRLEGSSAKSDDGGDEAPDEVSLHHSFEHSGGLLSHHIMLTMEPAVPIGAIECNPDVPSTTQKNEQSDTKEKSARRSPLREATPRKTLHFDADSRTPDPIQKRPPDRRQEEQQGQINFNASPQVHTGEKFSPAPSAEQGDLYNDNITPVVCKTQSQAPKKVRSPPLLRVSNTPLSSSDQELQRPNKPSESLKSIERNKNMIYSASQCISEDNSQEVVPESSPEQSPIANTPEIEIVLPKEPDIVVSETPVQKTGDDIDCSTEPPTPEVLPTPNPQHVRYIATRRPSPTAFANIPTGALRCPSTPSSSTEQDS